MESQLRGLVRGAVWQPGIVESVQGVYSASVMWEDVCSMFHVHASAKLLGIQLAVNSAQESAAFSLLGISHVCDLPRSGVFRDLPDSLPVDQESLIGKLPSSD